MPTLFRIRKRKMIGRKYLFVALASGFFLFTNAHALTQTLRTEVKTKYGILDAEIHFEKNDLYLAQRIDQFLKSDLIEVVNYFEYVPRDTIHFNIDHKLRYTNGNAVTFPTNIINLYNFPANNKEHLIVMEDWWKGLVLHEFTHVVHLDQTRDYLEIGRKIFGSVAKIPAQIVPRWFAEGVAVWSESKFTKAGRLQNELLNKELWMYLNREKSCQSIDCLDEPGTYPSGALAYWAGAHFLNYLETKTPKTIKCLLEANSKALPFFLDRTFEMCTDKSVSENFSDFLKDFKQKYAPMYLGSSMEKIPEAFGITQYQKGLFLDENRLFKAEKRNKSEALVAYDLEGKVVLEYIHSHPISDITGSVTLEEERRGLIVSFNDDPSYRDHNRVWKVINQDTLLEDSVLEFNHDPSYVIPMEPKSLSSNNKFFTASYYKNNWLLEVVNNEKVLSSNTLPTNYNVVFAKVIDQKIILKVLNNINGEALLLITNNDLKELKVFYQSSKYFDLFYEGPKTLGIKFKDDQQNPQTILFNIDEKITKSEMNPEDFKAATIVLDNEKYRLVLDRDLTVSIPEAKKILLKEEVTPGILTNEFSEGTKVETELYPRLDHFIPHYWFLAAGNSDNLGSIGATTSFSDPEGTHNFSVTGLLYPEVSRLGGTLDYLYSNDPYTFEMYFNQDYSKRDSDLDYLNDTRKFETDLYYSIYKKRLTYTPGAFFGVDAVTDFLSSRTSKYFGGRVGIAYSTNAFDDTLQSVTFKSRLAVDTPNSGESYMNFQNQIDTWFRISENFTVELKGSIGKLFKSDFARGVLYAGGDNSLVSSRYFEYYGLPYGNAYGNDVSTYRMKFDYNLMNIYKGKNMWPIFFKEWHVMLGSEMLSADRIYLSKTYFQDETIHSTFVGTKLKTNLFYLVPTDIDLVFSNIIKPVNGSVNTWTLLFNSAF
jgi:hypothetical protein